MTATVSAAAAALDIVGEFNREEGRVGLDLLESVARAFFHNKSHPVDGEKRARDESGTKRIVGPAASISAADARADVKAIRDIPAVIKRVVDNAPSISAASAKGIKAVDTDSDNEEGVVVDDAMDICPPADCGKDKGASTTAIADRSLADDAKPPLSPSAAAADNSRIPKDQERKERQDKESFLIFLRVLMNFLEQKDASMHAAAKALIEDCVEKSKSGDQRFGCLTTCMKTRLRSTVGELYWKKAHDYLDLLKQKREAHQMGNNPSVQQQGTGVQQQQIPGQQRSQQLQVTAPLQFAATAAKQETIPLSKPPRAAKPQSTSPVSVPIPAIVHPNKSSTNVSVSPATMINRTSKKEIEALKRKKEEEGEEGRTKKKQKMKDEETTKKRLAEMLFTMTMPLPNFCDDTGKKITSELKKKAIQHSYGFNNSSTDGSNDDVKAVLSATSKFAERSNRRNLQFSHQQDEADVIKLNSVIRSKSCQRFSRQQDEADLIKLDTVLRSKSGQRDALIRMAQLYNTLGDNERARSELERAGEVISAISNIEEDLMQRRTKYTQENF
jgi:hypothetical protein